MQDYRSRLAWGKWFRKVGVTDAANARGLKINNSVAVLQAAIEGKGVAVYRPASASLPRLIAFRDWRLSEAASQVSGDLRGYAASHDGSRSAA
jgi:LysR family glycine cleavage system transcriptional activator